MFVTPHSSKNLHGIKSAITKRFRNLYLAFLPPISLTDVWVTCFVLSQFFDPDEKINLFLRPNECQIDTGEYRGTFSHPLQRLIVSLFSTTKTYAACIIKCPSCFHGSFKNRGKKPLRENTWDTLSTEIWFQSLTVTRRITTSYSNKLVCTCDLTRSLNISLASH